MELTPIIMQSIAAVLFSAWIGSRSIKLLLSDWEPSTQAAVTWCEFGLAAIVLVMALNSLIVVVESA